MRGSGTVNGVRSWVAVTATTASLLAMAACSDGDAAPRRSGAASSASSTDSPAASAGASDITSPAPEARDPVCPSAERVSEVMGTTFTGGAEPPDCFYGDPNNPGDGSGDGVALQVYPDVAYGWRQLLEEDPVGLGYYPGAFGQPGIYGEPSEVSVDDRPALQAPADEGSGSGCRVLAQGNDGDILQVSVQSFFPRAEPLDPDCSKALALMADYAGPYDAASVNDVATADGPSRDLAELEEFCASRFADAMNTVDPNKSGPWEITQEVDAGDINGTPYGVAEYPNQSRATCGLGPNGESSIAYFNVYEFPFNDIEDADFDDTPVTVEDYKADHPGWESGFIVVDNVESCRLAEDDYLYCVQSWNAGRANQVIDVLFD